MRFLKNFMSPGSLHGREPFLPIPLEIEDAATTIEKPLIFKIRVNQNLEALDGLKMV